MCIDLFRPRHCLDIDFLFEQIWFSVDKGNPQKLNVIEVYDILLKNPKGNPPLDEVWALFSNNCIKDGKPQIQSIPVRPDMSKDMNIYNWAYQGLPRQSENAGEIIWNVATDCPDTYGRDTDALDGKSLLLNDNNIVFPDIREIQPSEFQDIDDNVLEECKSILASEKIQKTLVKIPFPNTPLAECERGWLRLIVTPTSIDALPAKSINLPGVPSDFSDEYTLYYEQRLGINCPLVLRSNLNQNLDGIDIATKVLKNFLKELFLTGSSTRIFDHRICLIVPQKDLDIYDTVSTTTGVRFYGMIPIFDQKYMIFLWACGSYRNLEEDLVHNAMRIIDRLYRFGPAKQENLSFELAPSGRHEAFSLLINIMVEVGLLRRSYDDNRIELPETSIDLIDDIPILDDFDFNNLRMRYLLREARNEDQNLIRVFSDLHPFRIFYRVVWPSPSKSVENLVGLLRQVSELNLDVADTRSHMRDLLSRIKQIGKE
jgi:hypothetical protein